MIEVRRTTSASVEDVWSVLADGWLFPVWVVGASRMRAVDESWPSPGATLQHSVGSWPLLLDDETRVIDSTSGTVLVMQAKGWPLGEARIELLLAPTEHGGCEIVMREDATVGPGRFVPYPARWAAVAPRNVETLRRLVYVAEGRSR